MSTYMFRPMNNLLLKRHSIEKGGKEKIENELTGAVSTQLFFIVLTNKEDETFLASYL